MTEKLRFLFVCVGNACRSQMAEGFAKALGQENAEVWSAGSRPAGWVYSGAIEAMKEVGIDIGGHWSKGIPELPAIPWDYVVTMGCGDACPALPARERRDWNIPDPVGLPAGEFRAVRDLIRGKVQELLKEVAARAQEKGR